METIAEHIERLVSREPMSGCWLWLGTTDKIPSGIKLLFYHRFGVGRKGRKSYMARVYVIRHKAEAFNAYGGCHCVGCGETDMECLSIDHINQNGAEHRRQTDCGGGSRFYKWLKVNGYPSGFRVLCMNCQWRARAGTLDRLSGALISRTIRGQHG